MMQFCKENHYVPKLYLKQWSKEGKISTYRLLVPSASYPLWIDQRLKGIAYQSHLYTSVAGLGASDEIEKWLGREFESPAQEAISLAINNQRMSPEHWNRLTRFAVAQDLRTPARLKEFLARQRGTLETFLNETLENSIGKLEEAVELGLSPLSNQANTSEAFPVKINVEKLPDGGGRVQARAVVGRELWLWNIKHLLTNTIGRLPRQRWTILRAPDGVSWPTSDNPLIRLNYQDASKYDFGGGWGVKNVDILLPLSPKHMLHSSIGKRSWARGTVLDVEMARLMRRIIIEHADRYIFSSDPEDIHLVRSRIVCPDTYSREQEAWKSWHDEQCRAEVELQTNL
jgi:hypothetical protein